MFAPLIPTSLAVPDTHPLARRMAALSEPRLYLLRRPYDEKAGRLASQISVDEVRRMKGFFALSAADGGRRVAIIDPVDEMNTSAANALLKLLEEPPSLVTLILISHQPARLLPTIRSRCRELRLPQLDAEAMSQALRQAGGAVDPESQTALAELAAGSVGEAFRLSNLNGLKLYEGIVALFAASPRLSRPKAQALADSGAGKGSEAQFDLIANLLDLLLARLARAGSTGIRAPEAAKGEADLIARLSPGPIAGRSWADLAQKLGQRARRGAAVNLDRSMLLMDMILNIDQTAKIHAQR